VERVNARIHHKHNEVALKQAIAESLDELPDDVKRTIVEKLDIRLYPKPRKLF
jgi:hypothetical protein